MRYSHHRRWKGLCRPDLEEFIAEYDRPPEGRERADLTGLPPMPPRASTQGREGEPPGVRADSRDDVAGQSCAGGELAHDDIRFRVPEPLAGFGCDQ
jgi:hypothetical protein